MTKTKKVWRVTKYLDNGYGLHGYVDVYVEDDGKNLIVKIDGLTTKEIEEELHNIIDRCRFQQKYDTCIEELCPSSYRIIGKS